MPQHTLAETNILFSNSLALCLRREPWPSVLVTLLSVSSRCTLQAACNMFMRGANESLIHLGRKDYAELIARFDIEIYIVFSNVYNIL